MSQKNITPIILFVLTLACIAGYFVLHTKNSVVQEPTQTPVALVEYKNTEYGFVITLPSSWKGYSSISNTWKAYSPNKPQGSIPDETGPLLSVRHPLWSETTPRQDIPVMVFTLLQWNLITQDKIHVGAAPINPSELARNTKYVFALPARYNFAYPVGYEEVETILQTKPIRGF